MIKNVIKYISGIVILDKLFTIFLKEILNIFDRKGDYLRKFVQRNNGVFTVFFLFLFFIEQIVLMICVYYFLNVSSTTQFVVSIFALIVVTTATLEKFILEKKYEYQSKEVNRVSYDNENILEEMKILYDKGEELEKENKKLKKLFKKKR